MGTHQYRVPRYIYMYLTPLPHLSHNQIVFKPQPYFFPGVFKLKTASKACKYVLSHVFGSAQGMRHSLPTPTWQNLNSLARVVTRHPYSRKQASRAQSRLQLAAPQLTANRLTTRRMGTIVEARGGVETVVGGVDGVAVVVETDEMDLGKSICLFLRSKICHRANTIHTTANLTD